MTDTATRNPSRPKKKSAVMARPLNLWQDNSQNQEVRIEIMPLIDVIFCILTFFILGAVEFSRQQAIQLDLPKATTGTPQMREMLVVSLDDFGRIYVTKPQTTLNTGSATDKPQPEPVTQQQLYSALENYQKMTPDGRIVLHASRNVSYNEVAQVLDTLRQVGGSRVALATLPGEATSTNNPSSPNRPSSPNSSTFPTPQLNLPNTP
ncbi:MAG: ExbD/TolR family protein [Microcystaceae cyanobacterium]